jgi:signal transduction histidine kinase
MPQVAVTIYHSRGREALEAQMLEAEKKSAMADLARSVSHDVNNAIGSVLPLVQQLVSDGRDGRLDTASIGEDLDQIERSLQVCRRIFGGMLAFARGAARGSGVADVSSAVDAARAILADGMERRKIRFEADLPETLPPIQANQSDLEQLFLNLMSNARDAMPQGGVLAVSARVLDGYVELRVSDDGVGIPERDLARIQEPFYTTKQHGSGLGLAICRSILWGLGGEFAIDSRPGAGTRIRFTLPIKDGRGPETEED